MLKRTNKGSKEYRSKKEDPQELFGCALLHTCVELGHCLTVTDVLPNAAQRSEEAQRPRRNFNKT